MNEYWASQEAGEVIFDMPEGISRYVDHPFKVLISSVKGGIRNFKGVFSNRKMLIASSILGLVWLALAILKAFDVNVVGLDWLSIGTFAHGGLSANPVEIFGGIFGKAVYATMLLSLLNGAVSQWGQSF